jgi:DNA polymerase-3 subunit gamma/tau
MIKELECKIDKKEINGEKLFKKLLEEVKKRDEELGICFETSVKFISFDGKVLKWESCPDNDCKGLFRRYFSSVIRPLINDIFGIGVKIDVIRCEEKKPITNSKILSPTLNEEDKLIRKVREVFGSDVEITKLI